MNKITLAVILLICLINQNLYCSDRALKDDKAVEFLRSYFTAARTYDNTKMFSLLSRDAIEHALSNIVLSDSDIIMKRNVRLALNEYFAWPYCLIHVLDVNENVSGYEVRIGFEKNNNSPESGVEYKFYLIYENNDLMLKNFLYTGKDINKFNNEADIDICSVPINKNNVSLLLPGETIEEQRKRLDIPELE